MDSPETPRTEEPGLSKAVDRIKHPKTLGDHLTKIRFKIRTRGRKTQLDEEGPGFQPVVRPRKPEWLRRTETEGSKVQKGAASVAVLQALEQQRIEKQVKGQVESSTVPSDLEEGESPVTAVSRTEGFGGVKSGTPTTQSSQTVQRPSTRGAAVSKLRQLRGQARGRQATT